MIRPCHRRRACRNAFERHDLRQAARFHIVKSPSDVCTAIDLSNRGVCSAAARSLTRSIRLAAGRDVPTHQVFVSHTSDMTRFPRDRSFVRAVLDALSRAGLAAVDMAYFAAREGQPADYCQQRVRDCEIYLAVVGFRYGSLVPGESVSYTELEFVEATVTGKPRLVFILDEDSAGLPEELIDDDRAAVDAFRRRLQDAGLIVAGFSSAEGLELAVFQAIQELVSPGGRVVPRQLPAALAHFAGRSEELTSLTALLRGRSEIASTIAITAVGGTAGVGKTALAVQWAHQVVDRFPDGQLYVDLRGFSPGGQPVAPSAAVRRFLDALDMAPERIPADLDAQTALYRSLVAGRRMLIILDNARDSAQVRPLLPGTATCMVVVTSRNQMSGLVAAAGAAVVDLDLLSEDESRDLLIQRLGMDRITAEPGAVAEIVTRCARLPLALALVAAHAAIRPRTALHALAAELRDARRRWETLSSDDPAAEVRAVFSWSYHALTPAACRLFRLLGLHPGPDATALAAASLAGLTPTAVRPLLAELIQAGILVEPTAGRYTFHDLLRGYATELAHTTDTDEQRRTAISRVLDHYLHTAQRANQLLDPSRQPTQVQIASPMAGVVPEPLDDYAQAWAWFTAERAVLLTAIDCSATAGLDTHTWQLAWTVATFLDRQGHWHDLAATWQAAVVAAQRLADPLVQARAHHMLAGAYILLSQFDDALTHMHHALDVNTRAGDRTKQAYNHRSLAVLWGQQGQYAQALHHAQQALQLYQETGHQEGLADALGDVGWCHALLGEYQPALAHCQQALALNTQLGSQYGQAVTLDSLGYIHHHMGQQAHAISCYQRALALARDLGDRYLQATALAHLGDIHVTVDSPDAAISAWQQALTILDDLNHPDAAEVRAKLARLRRPAPETAR